MSDRLLIISADCHAAARWPDYEPYFEKKYLGAFRDWYGARREVDRLNRMIDDLFELGIGLTASEALQSEGGIGVLPAGEGRG